MTLLEGLPVCLSTYQAMCAHSARALITYDRNLSQGWLIAKASEIATCFGGMALEGGLEGGVGVFQLDALKIGLPLAGVSKLPNLTLTKSQFTYRNMIW